MESHPRVIWRVESGEGNLESGIWRGESGEGNMGGTIPTDSD